MPPREPLLLAFAQPTPKFAVLSINPCDNASASPGRDGGHGQSGYNISLGRANAIYIMLGNMLEVVIDSSPSERGQIVIADIERRSEN